MNEQQFLDLLDSHLQNINAKERADIRRDFEEYFDNGRAEGKTTEEIITSFGSIEELAAELLASYDEEDFVQAVSLEKNTTPYRHVTMESENVAISVVATDAEEPMIEVKDKDDLTTATMTMEGDTLVVKATRQEKVRKFLFITIIGSIGTSDVIVHLPKKYYDSIQMKSSNGAIKLADVGAQKFMLRSDNGRIVTNNIKGDVLDAHTSNGRIVLENTSVARVKAQTQNGRIEIEKSKGQRYHVESFNGRIVLKQLEAEITARTSNGRIEAQMQAVQHPMQLTTDNGRIVLATAGKLENVIIEGQNYGNDVQIYSQNQARYEHGTKAHVIQLKTRNGKVIVEELSE